MAYVRNSDSTAALNSCPRLTIWIHQCNSNLPAPRNAIPSIGTNIYLSCVNCVTSRAFPSGSRGCSEGMSDGCASFDSIASQRTFPRRFAPNDCCLCTWGIWRIDNGRQLALAWLESFSRAAEQPLPSDSRQVRFPPSDSISHRPRETFPFPPPAGVSCRNPIAMRCKPERLRRMLPRLIWVRNRLTFGYPACRSGLCPRLMLRCAFSLALPYAHHRILRRVTPWIESTRRSNSPVRASNQGYESMRRLTANRPPPARPAGRAAPPAPLRKPARRTPATRARIRYAWSPCPAALR